MSEFNPARGDVEISLGSVGTIVCRPDSRALMALDDLSRRGPLTEILRRLAVAQSLNDVVDVLYETHVSGTPSRADRLTRNRIADGVVEVGMDTLYSIVGELVGQAWSQKQIDAAADRDEDEAGDPRLGEAERAGESQSDSPPVNGSQPPSSDSESTTTQPGG